MTRKIIIRKVLINFLEYSKTKSKLQKLLNRSVEIPSK